MVMICIVNGKAICRRGEKMDIMHMDESYSYHTMVIATVCGYGNDEHKATIQVQLPYMEKDNDILENVELLLGYGGKTHGFLQRPEIGDQVLLTFLGNHNRKAIALGVVANHDSSIWRGHNEKNECKRWQMKNGLKVEIWDEADHTRVALTNKEQIMQIDEEKQMIEWKCKDLAIKFDGKEGQLSLMASKELKLQCGESSLLMKKDGSITIHGKKITIDGQELSSKTMINTSIQAQKVIMDAKLEVSIHGNAGVKINSNGISEIKGGLVKLG